jgi:mono/diheme cytochrome c family protein
MKITRIAMLLGSVATLAACAANDHAPNALASASPTSAVAASNARVGNFLLVDQNLEAHELYRLADAPAVVIVTQQNGDAVIRGLAPQLNRIAADYGARRVEFMMLNSSVKDGMETIQAEATKAGYKVPVLMDSNQIIGETLGVSRSGEALVIDPKTWQVVYHGAVAGLPAALDAMLAGKPVPAGAASAGALIAFPAHSQQAQLTYVKDVAPILEKRCVACHEQGGIGPFAMNSYAVVKGFAPMIAETIRTDRMPPYHADPHVGKFSDSKRMTPEEIKTVMHWVEAGAPRGEGDDPLAKAHLVAADWPLGKPDLILDIPQFKVAASGVVDYQRPFTLNPETQGHWIRATSVKPGDRQAVHHVLSGWMSAAPANGKTSNEGMWRQSVGRYAVGSESDVYDGTVGTYLPAGGAVGFQMHYTPYGKETVDHSQIGVYFAKEPPKYIMRQTAISDPTIDIPAGAGHHMEMAYQEFPKDALLYDAFIHAHYRATASDLWLQYPDGKKKLLVALPRYDFNWQRAYTFAEPVKIPAGSKLIARYWYDNSKRNPHNPDPSIEVTWGEQSFQEMLFTQVDFRWMDETAAAQIDSDARLGESRLLGFLDKDLDGKVEKAELRGQIGKTLLAQFDALDTDHDGSLDKAELKVAMSKMQMQRRRNPAEEFNGPASPKAAPASSPTAGGR